MLRYLRTLTLIGLCLSAPVISYSQEGTTMTEDQKAVLDTIHRMTSSYNGGDIDAVMTTYAAGASVAFQPGVVTAGAEDIRAAFEASRAINPQFEFGGNEVIVQGDTALHITPWSMMGTMPDGQAIAQSGLSVAVLRRQADGAWLMVIDNPHGSALLAGQ